MGFYRGPNIVTDDLKLAVDAGSERSYPGSGTTVDSLIGSHVGTLTNGVGFSSSNGGAFDFDGADDYISIAHSTALQNASNLTLEAWVKIDTNTNSYLGIIGKGTTDANEEYCIILSPGNQNIYMDVGQGGGPYVSPGYTFDINTWYHIVGTHERTGGLSTLKIYVNGVYQPATVIGPFNTPNTNTAAVTIGSRFANGGIPWAGEISLARIYTRTLPDTEVLQNFNAQKSRFGL